MKLRKFIKNTITQYLNENINDKIYSGEEVYKYFLTLGSENPPHDNPIVNYKEQIISNNYILKQININYIINNDVDIKYFVNNEIKDYSEGEKINSYGLIGDSSFAKDVVLDGFHRLTQKLANGEKFMKFFVPINKHSKYENI